MCGRFTLRQPEELASRFQASMELGDEQPSRFNAAPTQTLPIVVPEASGRRLQAARWGLVPAWAKDLSIGNRLFNARAETLAEKPSFRAALRARRCLVPADGFYEWRAEPAAPGRRAAKTPIFFHRPDDALFAFAGLYERWRSAAGEEITSFTIITTDANPVVAPVHDRMPVVLAPEDEAAWLAPDAFESGAWRHLLRPAPAALLTAHPVSPLVNRSGLDLPEMVAPSV
jgi:putative SOS response-associated peptidase YedK